MGDTDPASRFESHFVACPNSIHIDPQRKQMCAVHALRNAVQDKKGQVITDELLVQGAKMAAYRLKEALSLHYDASGGGNF